MTRLAALICLLARHTNAEGGRGHAVASSTWQSTQHLPSDYVPSTNRASVNCSRFVVITSQRSGSRYFMDKLKSHASIRTARQARLERLKAEAKAAEAAGALGLKKGEGD